MPALPKAHRRLLLGTPRSAAGEPFYPWGQP
jgi:hypothetical protein